MISLYFRRVSNAESLFMLGKLYQRQASNAKKRDKNAPWAGIRTSFQGRVGSLLGQPLNCDQCGYVRVGRIATALK